MPGVAGAYGSATPTAKIGKRQRYSPSEVTMTNRSPSAASSRRVESQRQPYRTATPARAANASRLDCISGRDGKSDVPSMNSVAMPRSSGSSASRLFQSQRSNSRDARSAGAYGLVQDSSRWKNGQRRNMPPGPSSPEMTACSMPSRPRKYEAWSAPGPEPTMTIGYSPGGYGRAEPAAGAGPAAALGAATGRGAGPRSITGSPSAAGSRCAGGAPAPGASGT